MVDREEFRPSPARDARRDRRLLAPILVGIVALQAVVAVSLDLPWQRPAALAVVGLALLVLHFLDRLPIGRRRAAWMLVSLLVLTALALFGWTAGTGGRVALALLGLGWLFLVWRMGRPDVERSASSRSGAT